MSNMIGPKTATYSCLREMSVRLSVLGWKDNDIPSLQWKAHCCMLWFSFGVVSLQKMDSLENKWWWF